MIHSLVSRPLSHNLKLSMNSSWLDSVRNRRANGTRQPTDNGCLLREGPIAPSVQNIPLLEPPRRDARWSWVAVTSVKIPLTRGMQNYYSKKCTSLILEPPCFSPWVVKMTLWIFSVLTRQGLGVNDLFLAGRKNENVFSALRNPTPPRSSWSCQLDGPSGPRAWTLHRALHQSVQARSPAPRDNCCTQGGSWLAVEKLGVGVPVSWHLCVLSIKIPRLVPLFLAQWNPAWN